MLRRLHLHSGRSPWRACSRLPLPHRSVPLHCSVRRQALPLPLARLSTSVFLVVARLVGSASHLLASVRNQRVPQRSINRRLVLSPSVSRLSPRLRRRIRFRLEASPHLLPMATQGSRSLLARRVVLLLPSEHQALLSNPRPHPLVLRPRCRLQGGEWDSQLDLLRLSKEHPAPGRSRSFRPVIGVEDRGSPPGAVAYARVHTRFCSLQALI